MFFNKIYVFGGILYNIGEITTISGKRKLVKYVDADTYNHYISYSSLSFLCPTRILSVTVRT